MINNRIKQLRKTLKLSGEKFGERIGVKNNTISQLETGKNNPTEQTIKFICREFNVNEEWLRTGKGDMFIETLDDYLSKFNLDDIDLKIVKNYLAMNEEQRQIIKDYIKKVNS